MTHLIIAYDIFLVKVRTSDYNNNLLILDVKQLNKIVILYYFYTLKALWDGQGKIKMYYGMSRFKNQLSRISLTMDSPKIILSCFYKAWKNNLYLKK